MNFTFLTLFPQLIDPFFEHGILGQARKSGVISHSTINPREFAINDYGSVDDRPFGGGDGMVLLPQPLTGALKSILPEAPLHDRTQTKVISLSPQGLPLSTKLALELTKTRQIIFVCGRYSGIDQRFVEKYVDLEISTGDYVLSGGELPALAVADAVARMIPGVLGHERSALDDSFAHGRLEHPLYTKPRNFEGLTPPEVLLSGDHKRIEQWRLAMNLLVTIQRRPDLLVQFPVTQDELKALTHLST